MSEVAGAARECRCGGIGWVVEPDGGVGRARRCTCSPRRRRKLIKADPVQALLEVHVPRKYALDFVQRRFENPGTWPRDPRAPEVDPRAWRGRPGVDPWAVSFFGNVGVGKTRLALELLYRGLLELKGARFLRARQIARLAFDGGWEGRYELRHLEQVELLLVDDLGVNHPGGAWGPVADLLIGRSDEARATLVTSHLTLRHVSDAGQPGLASRLTEGLVVQVEGDDRRGLWVRNSQIVGSGSRGT